ncbi:MAG: hypothetical protein IJI74_07075 [Firmicutes bacterium]|nr:hypothetical protein [Bacillota bacterium]
MKKRFIILLAMFMAFAMAACGSSDTKDASDDGQNPVMNFIGDYCWERADVHVEAGEGNLAMITVTWGGSAFESAQWTMSGDLDTDALTVKYSDCVKTNVVYDDDGNVTSEKVEYENGTGTITFSDGENLTLTWDDDQEQAVNGEVFEYTAIER